MINSFVASLSLYEKDQVRGAAAPGRATAVFNPQIFLFFIRYISMVKNATANSASTAKAQ